MSLQGSYDDALKRYVETDAYSEAKHELSNELFWKIGSYHLSISAVYGNMKKNFKFQFDVSQEQYQQLQNNIEETLVMPLKQLYRVPLDIRIVESKLNSLG